MLFLCRGGGTHEGAVHVMARQGVCVFITTCLDGPSAVLVVVFVGLTSHHISNASGDITTP